MLPPTSEAAAVASSESSRSAAGSTSSIDSACATAAREKQANANTARSRFYPGLFATYAAAQISALQVEPSSAVPAAPSESAAVGSTGSAGDGLGTAACTGTRDDTPALLSESERAAARPGVSVPSSIPVDAAARRSSCPFERLVRWEGAAVILLGAVEHHGRDVRVMRAAQAALGLLARQSPAAQAALLECGVAVP